MADSAVAITQGTGTSIDTYQLAGGDHQQVMREAKVTAVTLNTWTVATTAATSQIAADASRVGMIMTNTSSGRVYLRFDSTAPTATSFHWFLETFDRWEVPKEFVALAVSMLGATANGTVLTALGTAA